MRRTKTHIITALFSLLVPAFAIAQGPVPPVTGLSASYQGGQVLVKWNPVPGVDVAQYRVYHSTTSILQNNGLYDDFEVTRGAETQLTITPPPGATQLYAAVIAVSHGGQESPYFTEEASTALTTQFSSASISSSAHSDPFGHLPTGVTTINDTSVKLLKGEARTPEEIFVTFSGPITVDADHAPEGLMISAPGGSKLRIMKITIAGSTITIHTEKQSKGTVYNVQFKEPFRGVSGLPLDATDRSVLVTGHAEGNDPTSAPQMRTVNPVAPPDVTDVRIVPSLQHNGLYALTIEWTADNGPKDLLYVIAYQTRDAQTFGPPSVLPVDIRGVQMQDVTPGFFGLYLQTVNIYGYPSPGVFHYVNLPPVGPGQAMRGDILYGQIDIASMTPPTPPDGTAFEVMEVTVSAASGSLAAMTSDATITAPPAPLEVPVTRINWMNAAILAAGVAGVLVLVVLSITMTQKVCRSTRRQNVVCR